MNIGHLRSGNLTWTSGMIQNDYARSLFGGVDEPETPIKTILEYLIAPYAVFGGVDMFIYIQVSRVFMNTTFGKNLLYGYIVIIIVTSSNAVV
jgi:hypothetical protein